MYKILNFNDKLLTSQNKLVVYGVNWNPLNLPPRTIRCMYRGGMAPSLFPYNLVDGVPDYSSVRHYDINLVGDYETYRIYDIHLDSESWECMFQTNGPESANGDDGLFAVLGANTSDVTNMGALFGDCHYLRYVESFDTGNVTNMNYMFGNVFLMNSVGNTKLNRPAFPYLDTSKVESTKHMFKFASSYEAIFPSYDLSKVKDATGMFMYFAYYAVEPASIFDGWGDLLHTALNYPGKVNAKYDQVGLYDIYRQLRYNTNNLTYDEDTFNTRYRGNGYSSRTNGMKNPLWYNRFIRDNYMDETIIPSAWGGRSSQISIINNGKEIIEIEDKGEPSKLNDIDLTSTYGCGNIRRANRLYFSDTNNNNEIFLYGSYGSNYNVVDYRNNYDLATNVIANGYDCGTQYYFSLENARKAYYTGRGTTPTGYLNIPNRTANASIITTYGSMLLCNDTNILGPRFYNSRNYRFIYDYLNNLCNGNTDKLKSQYSWGEHSGTNDFNFSALATGYGELVNGEIQLKGVGEVARWWITDNRDISNGEDINMKAYILELSNSGLRIIPYYPYQDTKLYCQLRFTIYQEKQWGVTGTNS